MKEFMVGWTLNGFTTMLAKTEDEAAKMFADCKCQITLDISPKSMQSTAFEELEIEHITPSTGEGFCVAWSLEGTTYVMAETKKEAREIFKQTTPTYVEYEFISIEVNGPWVEQTTIMKLEIGNVSDMGLAEAASA